VGGRSPTMRPGSWAARRGLSSEGGRRFGAGAFPLGYPGNGHFSSAGRCRQGAFCKGGFFPVGQDRVPIAEKFARRIRGQPKVRAPCYRQVACCGPTNLCRGRFSPAIVSSGDRRLALSRIRAWGGPKRKRGPCLDRENSREGTAVASGVLIVPRLIPGNLVESSRNSILYPARKHSSPGPHGANLHSLQQIGRGPASSEDRSRLGPNLVASGSGRVGPPIPRAGPSETL